MHVTVTGAGGFLGRKLVKELLRHGTVAGSDGTSKTITRIVACDLSLAGLPVQENVERVEGDTLDPAVLSRLVTDQTGVVFHLAAVVSVGAEEDFELGMRVNLDGTRVLLDACRKLGKAPHFLFASTAAVYGGDMPDVLGDGQALTPQTSYGTQKAICELLINDYSRRGFVDGRSLRLPTVVVRPGKPNKAASTFASSIIRDPLEGREVGCPVEAQQKMCLISPRKVIEAFIRAQRIPAKDFGYSRAVQLPAFTLSIGEMLAALKEVAGEKVAKRVRFEPDARIQKIVRGWPVAFKAERAQKLGFETDRGMKDVINAFVEDELNGKIAS